MGKRCIRTVELDKQVMQIVDAKMKGAMTTVGQVTHQQPIDVGASKVKPPPVKQ